MNGIRGAWWPPVLLILAAVIACQAGQSPAPSAPAASLTAVTVPLPGITASLPDASLKSRTPTPTPTIAAAPVLTAGHAVIGAAEPSPTRVNLETETPATPTPAVRLDATFEDPDGFFSLGYPDGWVISPKGGALLAPTGGGGLSMSIEIKAVTPASLADRYAAWYADQVDDYRELVRTAGSLSGYPALWIGQAFTSDEVSHRGLMAATVRNRVGFVFTGWAPEHRYAQLEPFLRAMIQGVRIAEFSESPPYSEWLTFGTSHVGFHYLPDSWIMGNIKGIATVHEAAFEDNIAALELDYAGPIDVYLYASEQSFYRATARDAGFAINEASEVHTRWFAEDDHQTPGHEITHVITFHGMGEPSEALLGEGLAVWLDHGGNDYDRLCAELQADGRFRRLADLLGEGWDGSTAAYYESGSFVGFLLETYGADKLRAIYTASDLPAALTETYRANLAALERKWLKTLK